MKSSTIPTPLKILLFPFFQSAPRLSSSPAGVLCFPGFRNDGVLLALILIARSSSHPPCSVHHTDVFPPRIFCTTLPFITGFLFFPQLNTVSFFCGRCSPPCPYDPKFVKRILNPSPPLSPGRLTFSFFTAKSSHPSRLSRLPCRLFDFLIRAVRFFSKLLVFLPLPPGSFVLWKSPLCVSP